MTDHAPTPRLSEWESEFADTAFGEATRKLRGFFRLHLRSRADAEDVVQQACLKVLESDDQVENLSALLFRTAVNIAHDRQRMAARRQRITQLLADYGNGEADPRTPESDLIARQELASVARVLDTLPPAQREAWLRWQAGEKQGDIAAAIGVTRRSVERYLADALLRMRRAAEREASK